jgi:hypothetical protein
MSRRRLTALAVATATLTLMSPTMTVATDAATRVPSSAQTVACAQRMHEAVVQDNVSYNARDEAAYVAVIHPDIIFHVAGTTTYDIDAHMEAVHAAWANPEPWEWQWEILSETRPRAGIMPIATSPAPSGSTLQGVLPWSCTSSRAT